MHSIRSLYKLLSSCQDRSISEHCQTFKMECFAKRIIPKCRCATRNISEQGRFHVTKSFQYTFCQKHKKKRPQRETFSSPRYSRNYILNGKLNPKMDKIRVFFPESWHFFRFSKKGSLGKYASISMNIPKCLNKLS